jgi:hypothetical protein
MNADSHPLTDDHYQKLQQVCTSCGKTAGILEKAKAAGLPIEQAEAENANNLQLAQGLKAAFFPNRP